MSLSLVFAFRVAKSHLRYTVKFDQIAAAGPTACTCGAPVISGFPCHHIIAAVKFRADCEPLHTFMDRRDRLDTWRETYRDIAIRVRCSSL